MMYQKAEIVPIRTAPQFSTLSTEALIATMPTKAPLARESASNLVYLVTPRARGLIIRVVRALKPLEMNMF
jgi:hypothetical protein